jgi:uncharacterized protein DUF2793
MSDISPALDLPYLKPSQAQKHVTHNEALQRLDLVVQLRLQDSAAQTPPGTPENGDIHALGAEPTGAWAGQAHRLAAWLDHGWHFFDPRPGWRAWDLAAARLRVWDGTAWQDPQPDLQNLDGAGIGTAWDATNRLAVAADASLFSHDGAGHRIKVNKAADTETASLLYQSGWTGHAEIGLAGDTALSVKVSADGAAWTEALRLDPATGHVSGNAVQVTADDTTPGRLMRADFGYCPGSLLGTVSQSAGVPTGAVIERGTNADGDYVRFADGTQICWGRKTIGSVVAEGSGTFSDPYRTASAGIPFPASFSDIPVAHVFCGQSGTIGVSGRIMIPTYGVQPDTITSLRAHRINDSAADVDVIAEFLAIGRWV